MGSTFETHVDIKDSTIYTETSLKRQLQVNDYYNSPLICRYCGSIIMVKQGQRLSDVRRKKYCNSSCSASDSNRRKTSSTVIKDKSGRVQTFCSCGRSKSRQASKCRLCAVKYQKQTSIDINSSRLLKDIWISGAKSSARGWSYLRQYSRRFMKFHDVPEQCVYCGFEHAIDCCHIKPISEFDKETTLVSEVVNLDNMIYLCKNHHWMLDNGKLSVKDIKEKSNSYTYIR